MTRLQRWVMYALTAFAVIDLVAFSILPQQPYVPRGTEAYCESVRDGEQHAAAESFWHKTRCDPVSAFTFVLAAFTVILAGATLGLLNTGNRQTRLAREEFLASHRPRLVLRRVMFDEETVAFPAERPRFMVEIANVGDSEAVISRLAIRMLPLVDLAGAPWRMRRELELVDPQFNQFNDVRIPNGGSHAIIVQQDERVNAAIELERTFLRGQGSMTNPHVHTLYCLGYVEYRDSTGKSPRRTGFIRRSGFGARWFERLTAPPDEHFADGFEYQD